MNILAYISIAPALLTQQPVTVVPVNQCTIEIACSQSDFTNNTWSAWVSQDMQTWWEFPQSCPGNRRICFIRGATNTFVRLVGTPYQPEATP
jgi:hypothetical protein